MAEHTQREDLTMAHEYDRLKLTVIGTTAEQRSFTARAAEKRLTPPGPPVQKRTPSRSATPAPRARSLEAIGGADLVVAAAPAVVSALATMIVGWFQRQRDQVEIEVAGPNGRKVRIKSQGVKGKDLTEAVEHVKDLLNQA